MNCKKLKDWIVKALKYVLYFALLLIVFPSFWIDINNPKHRKWVDLLIIVECVVTSVVCHLLMDK